MLARQGRFERNRWKVAKLSNDQWAFETLDQESYESAQDRAYRMLHRWLREEDEYSASPTKSDVWHACMDAKALPLFHDCLREGEELDRCNPDLDVSGEKMEYVRRAAWIANAHASREVKDAVGDELLLFLIVYELLRDLKRDGEESDCKAEWSDDSEVCSTTSDEESFNTRTFLRNTNGKRGGLLPIGKCDESSVRNDDKLDTHSEDGDELMLSDDSNECDESIGTISTRVNCQGRGARFKAIVLMDILLSNAASDQWEPDLDVDLMKMIVEALGASQNHPLNKKIVLPALSKVLTYWACRPSDFDEDHWDILRSDILPALQAFQKDWADELQSGALTSVSHQKRPAKRARRSARNWKDLKHLHHLRSEKTEAFSSLKECASTFPAAPSNEDGAANALSQCIETLTWMMDEKCLEWMMGEEWRPEISSY